MPPPRRSYTREIARYALDLSRHMTIKDMARHLGVSLDLKTAPIAAVCPA
ncbi:MAG: transposase family protein [Desulfobaccales bacterium]